MISEINKQNARAACHYSSCDGATGWESETFHLIQVFSDGLDGFK